MMMPVIPLITDRPEMLDEVFRSCRDAGAEFVIPGSMTLKAGRQRDYFLSPVKLHFPDELSRYGRVYGPASDRWGSPSADNFSYFGKLVDEISRPFRLNRRIPGHLFPGNITPYERAAVMLDQMHGILRDRGVSFPYGKASRAIWAGIDETGCLVRGHPISGAGTASGIGGSAEQIIREILDTGTSPVYEHILVGGYPSG
jgi:hypothetical protein